MSEEPKTPIRITENQLDTKFSNVFRITPMGTELALDFGLDIPASFTVEDEQVPGRSVNFEHRLVLPAQTALNLMKSLEQNFQKAFDAQKAEAEKK